MLCYCRYQSMADATKAMQQLDSMDIAGSKISVKIAAIAPNDPMTMMTANLDLDDEGVLCKHRELRKSSQGT